MTRNPRTVSELIASPWSRLLIELHDTITAATHSFWRSRNASTVLLPMTTGAVSSPMGAGSDSTPVRVSIGGFEIYLADSMQFYLEAALRITGKPVFYLMPSFRGEAADATHLPQFFHSECEIEGNLDDVIEIAESYVRALVTAIRDTCSDKLSELSAGASHLDYFLLQSSCRRLTFDEAAQIVPSHVVAHDKWRSLSRRGEAELIQRLGGPVWITHYDHLAVPFYQGFADSSRRQALNADLLLGSGELIGAGARHASHADLEAALAMHQVDPAAYSWYLEMKRNHPRTTAGFGLGLERLLMWVLQIADIRRVQLIPRDDPAQHLL